MLQKIGSSIVRVNSILELVINHSLDSHWFLISKATLHSSSIESLNAFHIIHFPSIWQFQLIDSIESVKLAVLLSIVIISGSRHHLTPYRILCSDHQITPFLHCWILRQCSRTVEGLWNSQMKQSIIGNSELFY